MAVKADWHLDLEQTEEEDPFGQRVQDVGLPIDLEGGDATLNERLVGLLQQEAELANAGVTCPLRDEKEAHCSACPVRHKDVLDPRTALCGVGIAQERTTTKLALLRVESNGARLT